MQRPLRADAGVPPRAGVGLKPEHYRAILHGPQPLGFFEIHAENYMGAGGPPHRYLEAIRADYPLSIHGVGLSIGGAGRLDSAHLGRLKTLLDRYEPGLFSEHLAWSSHEGACFNDLLPLSYTEESLALVCDHIGETQEFLGRRMLLENPSSYTAFAESTFSETDFLREIAARTGCGLLLDVNNVHVSAINLGFDPFTYIAAFPLDRVEELHVAGARPDVDETGEPIRIDTHDRPADALVLDLLTHVVSHIGPRPVLIEWDNDVPAWEGLLAEAERAQAILDGAALRRLEARNDAAA